MYQNQPFIKRYSWDEAQEYAKNFKFGGYNDWRLPSKKELKKLLTKTAFENSEGNFFYIREEFIVNMLHAYSWFWSSQSLFSVCDFRFKNGSDGWYNKSSKGLVMCVR